MENEENEYNNADKKITVYENYEHKYVYTYNDNGNYQSAFLISKGSGEINKLKYNDLNDNVDNNDNLKETQVKELIKNLISNISNKKWNNIVLLLGAGASIVNNKDNNIRTGKSIKDLAQLVENNLSLDEYNFKFREQKAKKNNFFNLEDLKSKVFYKEKDFNLENFLSHLESYISLHTSYEKPSESDSSLEKIKLSKEIIYDTIKYETSYEYDSNIFNHAKILKLLSKRIDNNNKLSIVTTNYDTLIEDAANDNDFTVFDGFSFSQIPKFDEDMFSWNLVKNVPNINTDEHIYKSKVINLLKIHGSLTWEKASNGNIIRKNKKNVINPVMIFPSSKKYMHSYEEPYFELMSQFQEFLKRPNTLFITSGFSFADNHISRMVIEAIKHNDSMCTIITNHNIDKSNENIDSISKLMNQSYPIHFLKAIMNGKTDVSYYFGG